MDNGDAGWLFRRQTELAKRDEFVTLNFYPHSSTPGQPWTASVAVRPYRQKNRFRSARGYTAEDALGRLRDMVEREFG